MKAYFWIWNDSGRRQLWFVALMGWLAYSLVVSPTILDVIYTITVIGILLPPFVYFSSSVNGASQKEFQYKGRKINFQDSGEKGVKE